ncbi:hypothetical protein C7447_102641 [Tenacibaculum adriaticum]|uniref:Uncharacterized protein n=1 Tax=Tenacibaculum adriaticum TaxID=413713 RepID=A0A5S5DXI6_9FLAO|nr:hypothetical protein [Tenacibaculum adriaticum]TYP99319.1 hypothetical protein C7447_102641 [Tenacibaculum adriaticum]
MKQGPEEFKVVKDNPKKKNKNYIFQNNQITRVGFYIVATALLVGIIMVLVTGFSFL